MSTTDRNRSKSKQPHGHSSYCFGCDSNHVHDGSKCSLCGLYQGPKRFKAGKYIPLIRDFEGD